jgi:hypothetical protein
VNYLTVVEAFVLAGSQSGFGVRGLFVGALVITTLVSV